MYPRRISVTVTTAASGGLGTGYTELLFGRLFSIAYVKDDFAAGVDFTIMTETTLRNLWVEDNVDATETLAPRQPCHDSDGAARFYNDDGDEPVLDHFVIADERIKIAIAEGGVSKSGTFHFLVG